MKPLNIPLPDSLEPWKLDGDPKRIDRSNIFDYMDGAGELYLGYHFSHLLVYRYRDNDENEILVELYQMKDSRDAFGLLSLDWGGEAVVLNQSEKTLEMESIVPSVRAFYGMGLLRIWSDNLYVRIMAVKETPGVKDVILELGKIITAGRKNPPPPRMVGNIRHECGSGWVLKKDRTAYFYSHLVLNSLYYLSHENILNLDRDTEAVMVVFEKNQGEKVRQRIHLLVIRYPDHRQAAAALDGFVRAYLPEMKNRPDPDMNRQSQEDFFQVEDGWLGYRLLNRWMALAFGCPDQKSGREILKQVDLQSF